MPKFNVSYTMTCTGTVRVDASDVEVAKKKVADAFHLSTLAREADDGEVEITDVAELDEPTLLEVG